MKGTTEIKNSYLFSILDSTQVQTDSIQCRYNFDNLFVSSNFETPNASWISVENADYVIWLDGHMYLKNSSTMNARFNLMKFLMEMMEHSYSYAKNLIAGGMYNLFVLDKIHKRLLIVEDSMGYAPLYYKQDVDGIYLSSHQFSFQEFSPLSELAVIEFLKYGYLPFSPSLFNGVKRLAPGQVMDISLETFQLETSEPQLFAYKPEDKRLTKINDAADELHKALQTYFSRFSRSNYLIGLGGKYDPRLITAWLGGFYPHLISLDSPKSEQLTEATLGSKQDVTAYGAECRDNFRIVNNLEHIKLMTLIERVRNLQPDYYLDGYMDDNIISYTDHFNDGKNVRAPDEPNKPMQENKFYANLLYSEREALDDSFMQHIMSDEINEQFMASINPIVDRFRPTCTTNEDFIESLASFTRGRNLLSAGTVGISAFTVAASPFADNAIREICLDMDKSIRDREHWRQYYDSKSRESGEIQNNRWKQVYRSMVKRSIFPDTNTSNDAETNGSQTKDDLDPQLFQEIAGGVLKDSSSRIPTNISLAIAVMNNKEALHPKLLLRYISLNYLLNHSVAALAG